METVDSVRENCMLLKDSADGVYIPQQFVREFYFNADKVCLVDEDGNKIGSKDGHKFILECLDDASCTENRYYDDAWVTILDSVYIVERGENSEDHETYSLHQSGDLWAIPMSLVDSLTGVEQEEFWTSFQ